MCRAQQPARITNARGGALPIPFSLSFLSFLDFCSYSACTFAWRNRRTFIDVIIGNDTGSNILTIFPNDLAALNYDAQTYEGNMGHAWVNTANGVCGRAKVAVEIMLMRADGSSVSGWFFEAAAVTPLTPGQHLPRLSGAGMRRLFYFASSPGNANLYVAEKRRASLPNFQRSDSLYFSVAFSLNQLLHNVSA